MRVLTRGWVLAVPLAVAGCGGVLDPQGPIAASERQILIDALLIMLALIVPTLLGAAGIIWWFREGNRRAKYTPTFTFSGRLEILVWSVPTLIIVFLGGLIWYGSHQLDPFEPLEADGRPLRIQVVSLDWKWLFVYPDQGIASVNQMVVPQGRPVALELTSASVMNTFWVPQLTGMIYTMSGMVTQLHMAGDTLGSFQGRSGNFSGDGFSKMAFNVDVVDDAAFAQWVDRAKSAGRALDRGTYEALEKPGILAQPVTFDGVQDGLFQQISTQAIPPSDAPANPMATKQTEN